MQLEIYLLNSAKYANKPWIMQVMQKNFSCIEFSALKITRVDDGDDVDYCGDVGNVGNPCRVCTEFTETVVCMHYIHLTTSE